MQNKKVIAIVLLFVAGFVLAYFFVIKKMTNFSDKNSTANDRNRKDIKDYNNLFSDFALNFPCGITDFDSPLIKPMKCDPEKMKKGNPIDVTLVGVITDENGVNMDNVKIVANNGEAFYSDLSGHFRGKITVDSIKESIMIVADKFGYSPIRKIYYAQLPTADNTALEIPEEFNVGIIKMREADVVTANLDNDIVVTSTKYPGVSVSIPARSLQNSKGEIVTGEVTGEITYLDPNKPEDAALTPGIEGSLKQMVGVNRKGEQVTLGSHGMTFFHFKQKDSDEILQPKEGTILTVTQPIPEIIYEKNIDPEALKAQTPTKEEDMEFKEKLGLKDGMSDEEMFKIYLDNDIMGSNYWYFNQRTGLWEEWSLSFLDYDVEKKLIIMKVSKLY
ncbi:MAG: hypothetical protein ACWGHO_03955 [Candidatus Moraniibacteriota bacterium]